MSVIDNSLIFGWWNTGLSPAGQRRASHDELAAAAEMIKYLLESGHVDCLALGEVTTEDLEEIQEHGLPADYVFHDGTERIGHLTFETGIYYNKAKLAVLNDDRVIANKGSHQSRVANRVQLQVLDDSSLLFLFISHWTSTVPPGNVTMRENQGSGLRIALDKLFDEYEQPKVILMGDYNEEPFGILENQVLAIRDRAMVLSQPKYLYNPFWRHIGEGLPFTQARRDSSPGGTCRLRTDWYTGWKTIDQIMVSAAFLGVSDWYLNEELTQVLRMSPRVLGQSGAGSSIFDHFPVITAIDKVKEGESDD